MNKTYKVALDDGHGMDTPGKRTPYIPEIGRSIQENEFNRAVVRFLDVELQRCGIETVLVAPTDQDTPLKERTDLANNENVDIYVSIHYDAIDGKFDNNDPEGHTIYVYSGQMNKEAGKLAQCVAEFLKNGTAQQWRGIKEANFHVLRETKMPAILSENGFMDNKREALLMISESFQKEVAKEHAQGICKYFGVEYVPESVEIEKHPIMGVTKASVDQMTAFVQKVNPTFNRKIAEAFVEIGQRYGVRADVAFCQSIHETNWFRFGGDVKPEQNNFAGIGATGNVSGVSFDTIHDGVTAQIQHLFAYATEDPLPEGETLMDPRFEYVQRGTATNWEDLAGRWAWPGYNTDKYANLEEALLACDSYGQLIIKLYEKLLQTKVEQNSQADIFEDVPTDHWAAEAIAYVRDQGIMIGYPDGTFDPDGKVTRAELAVVIAKLQKN